MPSIPCGFMTELTPIPMLSPMRPAGLEIKLARVGSARSAGRCGMCRVWWFGVDTRTLGIVCPGAVHADRDARNRGAAEPRRPPAAVSAAAELVAPSWEWASVVEEAAALGGGGGKRRSMGRVIAAAAWRRTRQRRGTVEPAMEGGRRTKVEEAINKWV